MGQDRKIRVLVAEDDEAIIAEYERTFQNTAGPTDCAALDDLENDLFGDGDGDGDARQTPDDDTTFHVVTCTQGAQAIAAHSRAIRDHQPFDVALIDVRMPPGIDGVETAERIRRADAHVVIGIVTGQADLGFTEIAEKILPPNRLFFIRKPFIRGELRETVLSEIERQNGATKRDAAPVRPPDPQSEGWRRG